MDWLAWLKKNRIISKLQMCRTLLTSLLFTPFQTQKGTSGRCRTPNAPRSAGLRHEDRQLRGAGELKVPSGPCEPGFEAPFFGVAKLRPVAQMGSVRFRFERGEGGGWRAMRSVAAFFLGGLGGFSGFSGEVWKSGSLMLKDQAVVDACTISAMFEQKHQICSHKP